MAPIPDQGVVDKYWLKGYTSAVDFLTQFIEHQSLSNEMIQRLEGVKQRLIRLLDKPSPIMKGRPELMLVIMLEHMTSALEERIQTPIKGFNNHEVAHLTNQLKRLNSIIELGGK